MSFLRNLLTRFDEALEWPNDPFLFDDEADRDPVSPDGGSTACWTRGDCS